jgi:hypothetical protein
LGTYFKSLPLTKQKVKCLDEHKKVIMELRNSLEVELIFSRLQRWVNKKIEKIGFAHSDEIIAHCMLKLLKKHDIENKEIDKFKSYIERYIVDEFHKQAEVRECLIKTENAKGMKF